MECIPGGTFKILDTRGPDWDETWGEGVYRFDLEMMQRHIFDFQSVKTENGLSLYDIGIIVVRNFTWRK